MNPDDIDIWIVDSSALIATKSIVSVTNQWDAFKHLEQMVQNGQIAMPRQVINEVSKIAHPDLPGAWAPGVRGSLQHPLDADYDHIKKVMSVAGEVVDVSKPDEDADPYVLALARQLKSSGYAVCIVTEDTVDRSRISIATACGRLQIDYCRVRDFLDQCQIPLRKEKAEET